MFPEIFVPFEQKRETRRKCRKLKLDGLYVAVYPPPFRWVYSPASTTVQAMIGYELQILISSQANIEILGVLALRLPRNSPEERKKDQKNNK